MTRLNPRHLMLVGAISFAGAAGVAAVALGNEDDPTPAPVPKAAETVPRGKFVKAVKGWQRERARADRLEATLRHDPSVKEAISLAAFTYGVDAGAMSRIAFCESRFDPNARNPTSTASGLFQFLTSTWAGNRYGAAGFSVWSPAASALGAAYHMSKYGDRAWACRP